MTELLLCLKGPNLQLGGICDRITETGTDRNVRSFNSLSYNLTLFWGKTIDPSQLISPLV